MLPGKTEPPRWGCGVARGGGGWRGAAALPADTVRAVTITERPALRLHEIVPFQQNAKARPHVPGRLRDTPRLSGEAQGLRTAWPPSGPHRPVALLPAPWGLGAGGCPAPGGQLPGEPLALPAWARPRSSGPALSPPLRTCQKYFCNWNLIWKMFYK